MVALHLHMCCKILMSLQWEWAHCTTCRMNSVKTRIHSKYLSLNILRKVMNNMIVCFVRKFCILLPKSTVVCVITPLATLQAASKSFRKGNNALHLIFVHFCLSSFVQSIEQNTLTNNLEYLSKCLVTKTVNRLKSATNTHMYKDSPDPKWCK